MEVVSTSNLVSTEAKKKRKKKRKNTGYNFQTTTIDFLVSLVAAHDLMSDQIGCYTYMQIRSYS